MNRNAFSRGDAVLGTITRWLSGPRCETLPDGQDFDRIDWFRAVPFFALHLACLGVIWVGFSPFAVLVAVGLYVARMFFITGFYHRYFSHRSYRTSRVFQFVMALAGLSAVQRGPLWWAAHHRHHHAHADREPDEHSPRLRGLLWSHTGWFLTRRNVYTATRHIRDLDRFSELRFLDRFDWIVPAAFATGLYLLGAGLAQWAPSLETSGPQLLVWGFFISTVVLYHGTYTINSLSHRFGTRRYETRDDSRNNLLLALLTLGEGWHNNHHYYSASARQGFRWWEVDPTYYVLRLLAMVGIVWDIKPVPAEVQRAASGAADGTERGPR